MNFLEKIQMLYYWVDVRSKVKNWVNQSSDSNWVNWNDTKYLSEVRKNTHNSNRSYGLFMTLGKDNLERVYLLYIRTFQIISCIFWLKNFWIPYEEIVGHPGFSFTCSRNIHCSFSYQLADVLVFFFLSRSYVTPS